MTKRLRIVAAVTGIVSGLLIIVWLMPHTIINFFTEYGEDKEVRWRGLTIQIKQGEVVLPKVTDTELIIRRKTLQDAVLMLDARGLAYADKMPLVRALCMQVQCTSLTENTRVVDGRKVRVVEYTYQGIHQTSMKEAYFWVSGSAVVVFYKGSNASFSEFVPTIDKVLVAVASAAG